MTSGLVPPIHLSEPAVVGVMVGPIQDIVVTVLRVFRAAMGSRIDIYVQWKALLA